MTRGSKAVLDKAWLDARHVKMPSGCWHWTMYINKEDGYGRCTVHNIRGPAHRVSFFIANGYWSDHTRHTCDNRRCVNPEHLIDGTNADNVRDRMERGIVLRGVSHPIAVLKNSEHEEIISLSNDGISGREISRRTGHSRRTVQRVLNGTHWSVRS